MQGSRGPFRAFVKNGNLLDPNFEKKIPGNVFDHGEYTLGIILSFISGL